MNRADIIAALAKVGAGAVETDIEAYAYLYAGKNPDGVEEEWLLVFRFEADTMVDFSIENRLVAP